MLKTVLLPQYTNNASAQNEKKENKILMENLLYEIDVFCKQKPRKIEF